MAIAKTGDTVIVDYTVRTGDGNVIGGTEKEGPQTLTLGGGDILAPIDSALAGMHEGAEQNITVPAADAFGPRRDELIIEIPHASLPQDQPPQPGMTLSAQQPDGSTVNLMVTDVNAETVTADGNHPLAGEDLHFDLKLLEVKPAA